MLQDHPFARYVRIVARGPNLSRSLTEEESLAAARMILSGDVDPMQLGAFLCVLRVRTEVPEEGAGFVRAIRETLALPDDMPAVDLDWSSYSGKKRQLPWFILAALLLAQNGVRLFMHGSEGHTPGRIYTREVLETLGVPVAASLDEAGDHIRARNFAYLPLRGMSPRLQDLIELRPVIGVRTPINTFVRLINPFAAPHVMQSVFHPNYGEIHRGMSALLAQPNMAVFKGEGGEVERRPQKPVVVQSLMKGKPVDEEWPPLLPDAIVKTDDRMDLSDLMAIWRGAAAHPYGEAAIVGTAAIALRLLGRAASVAEAEALARRLWKNRTRDRLAAAA